mgnify:CR=1 FL=1
MSGEQRNDILNDKEKFEEYYKKGIEFEFRYFAKKFIDTLNFIKINSIEPVFNLIDVIKYIDFRKSFPKLDSLYLMLFIFVYRFDKLEIQEKIRKALDLNLTSDFNPHIDYDENNNKLIVYLGSNISDNIEIKINNPDKIKKTENIRLFKSLTKIQKLGIIFLICCIKSGKIPLIQGETASGKSYLMKIFAQIFGQEMILYQITANSGISIITGQDIIKTEIEEDELKKLKKCYKSIKEIIRENQSFDKFKEEDYHLILTKIYNTLKLDMIHNNLSFEDKNKLNYAKKEFRDIVLLPGRLDHKKSSFILAAERGGWVFLDGIEMGQSILFDTISSLCGENPQLNVLDSENTIILNKKKMSDKFKLFLTFNPSNLGKKTLNQILFNLCARFSLTSLDTYTTDSTVVLYNSRYEHNINKKLWLRISSKLASCHRINVEKSKIFVNLMAGGIKFSPRHLTFLGYDGKKNKIPEKSEEIGNWVKSIFDLYYFNSFSQNNTEFSLEELEKEVYDEFIKNENFNELENIDENKLEVEIRDVLKDLTNIQKSNEQNIFNFNFRGFVKKCMKITIKEENIQLIIDNIEDTINLLNYENKNKYNFYDETLSNYFQINIIKNLFVELKQKMAQIDLKDIHHLSLDSKDLLLKDKIKIILLKLKLLLILLDDEELFTDKLNYKIYDKRFKFLISIFKDFVDNRNLKKAFKKLIYKCSNNSSLFEILDFFFPKHKISKNKDYYLINLYINIICELIRNKVNFSIEIDRNLFEYNPNKDIEYGRIHPKLCLNKSDSFVLTAGTKISIPLINSNVNEFEIKRDFEDSETILKFIKEYAPKRNLNKNIAEIYNNFQKKGRKNEEKEEIFTSEYFFNPEKNNNIYSRAWSILYALTPKNEVYKFLLNFYFEEEKVFFKNVENHYNSLDFEEIINFYKKRFFYYNKNSFLWLNLNKKLNIDYLNKDDINSKLIDIRKEIDNLKIVENNGNEQKDVSEDRLVLLEIQNKLEKRRNQIELDEEYSKAEKELNQIKNQLINLNVQKTFEIWKTNLIKEINNAFNLTKEDMIKKVNILQKDYESLVTINEEKMFKNNIDWKIPSIKSAYEKSSHIKLYDIILQYNSCLEVIKKIENLKMINNKTEIMKVSSDLCKKSEINSLIKYIISFEDYQNFNFEYANSICRATLMLNLYKNNISIKDLLNFFNEIDEKKKRIGQVLIKEEFDENKKSLCIEKNKLLQSEYIYICKIAGSYNLDMDIIIPNFKINDILHLFFTFENKEKYYYGPAFDNIEMINKENLYEQIFKNVKEEIKKLDSFKDVAGKVALMFYKYFNKDFIEIPELVDGEKIINYINNNNKDKTSEKYQKLKVLVEVIKLGIFFDKYKEKKEEKNNNEIEKHLDFEDFRFLKEKFDINSILSIENMPSFQYFLINNYDNMKILLNILTKEKINKIFEPSPYSFMPFWVFIIRIMSSTNCLVFENNKNPFEKELTKIIRNRIALSIDEGKNVNNISWINLTTDKIEFDNIFNRKIHMFYAFFNKICSIDSFSIHISKYINNLLIDNIYKSLFELSFSSQFDDLCETDIKSNKYIVLEFVKNPKEYIKKHINEKLSKIMLSKLIESNSSNYSKSLEVFISIINQAQKELKDKVEILEEKLRIKNENDIIKKFKDKYKRDINADEKDNLLRQFESQKIYFGQLTIDGVIVLFRNTEQLLKKTLDDIKKLMNNKIIELNEFNLIYEKLKNNMDKFEVIYNVEDEFCDTDFKNYLNNFKQSVNTFKNNFNIFSYNYNDLPKIDTDKIYMKDYSLPELQNTYQYFDLNEIEDNPNILSQPLLIQKNNKLFCNYKKIYFNPGPISPELFNELGHLKIYSSVDDSLKVELENIIQNNEEKKENEIIGNVINENQIKENKNKEKVIEEHFERKIIDLYDTNDKQYMTLKKTQILPETPIDIDFSFPPPNTSKEEIIYRLRRNLKVSNNSSFTNIIIEIIFIVCPIQIDFSCQKYSLTFEDGKYKLNAKKLLKGEIINFKIDNNYKEIPFSLKHRITSLDKDTYDEPKIEIINSNEINLIIKKDEKNIEDIDILNCLLEIYISEKIKIPILIDALIISTYFDFYIYDYETKSFVTDKMSIYIPTFEEKCQIELHFLVSTISGANIIGLFSIPEISEGISVIGLQNEMNLNLKENNFSIKLEFDMKVFNDNEIAVFDFSINNVVKKILLLQKTQKIKNIDLNLIKKVENKQQLEIHNLNEIEKSSFLISPFTCWGKGIFLFRECYINGKKDLELEIPQNSILYYLSSEGYLEKNKDDNYLIIIQMNDHWYSTIGFDNFISISTFQHILMTKINNFYDDFSKYFPKECRNISGNMFEYFSRLLLDKAKDLIKDKEYVFDLIKNNEDILHLDNKNYYYYFNKENYILNNSKTLEALLNTINETEFELYNDNKNDNIIEINDDNKGNKFLIQNGIPIDGIYRKDLIHDFNFGKSEINSIEISEINFIQIPKIITINSLIKFYDDCDLGTIVFPLYIYNAKKSKNEEEQKKINDYFTILYNAYISLEKKDDILISEYINHFKKSFEFMISKIMAVGFKSRHFNFPNILKFKYKDNINDLMFTIPQKGQYKIPQTMFTKKDKKTILNNIKKEIMPNKNIIKDENKENNENKENYVNKEENLINYNNIFQKKKKYDTNNNYIKDNQNKNKIINVEEKHLMFCLPLPIIPLELPKEIQKIYIGYDLENEVSNRKNQKKQELCQKEIHSNNPITGNEFDNINFNVVNEIKTIIENMKNANKSQFNYKTDKNFFALKNINEFFNDINEEKEEQKEQKEQKEQNEKDVMEFLENLIYLSNPITKKLIKEISIQNFQKDISFNSLEVNILFDCARIINIYHKYIFFIFIIGLTNALSYLEINYIFAVIGDCHFKAIIKGFNEPHSKAVIKRIFECITIERYRTNIASCAKVALDKFPIINENNQRIFYFFTNGLDDEYKLYDEWNKEIFDKEKNFFSFLFYLPFDEIKQENDFTYVWDQLNEFSIKFNNKRNVSTFIIKDKKDIFKNNILNQKLLNIFIAPLISFQEQNLDIQIYKSKFEILNDNILKQIDNFIKHFIEYEDLNYEDEEIFSKKESFNYKISIPKIDIEETKEVKLKVGKIISIPIMPNLPDFIKNSFKIPKDKINLQLLEVIFEPNLPTETILTDVGTQIDIYEFIKLCINPTANPKIYRQLGDGFVKNYGLTLVIDSSYSCLGGISREHTINTIRYLLSALSYIDLPSFNLIISTETNPLIICSEKGTLDALSNKSQIWGSLLYILNEQYKCKNTNLASAIRAAYNVTNARKQEHTDYLFVLTDGLFQKFEKKKILEEVIYCYSKNLLIIGIGVGYYPYGIEKLFPYNVYSRYPNKIIEALAICFSDSKVNDSELNLKDPNYKDLIDKIDNYYEFFKNYKSDTSLVKHLKKIPIFLNSFSIYTAEVNNKNQEGKLQSIEGPMRNAMYIEGSFKNKKILVVMLYSAEMNLRENPYLSYRYIKKSQPGKYYNIERALQYLKIQVDYAIDYELAIEKLTENNKGYCNYYACLILSGEPYAELPRNNNNNSNNPKPHLLGEFIKVIIQFWKNGGGLGLFSDNAPFTFQTNLILEQLFNGSIQFRVGGFHEGKKILRGVESGILEEKGTFNRKVQVIDTYQRPLITHSLYEMYEGNTVSYIVENPNNDDILYFGKNEKLKMITEPRKLIPFIPLSKDSDGGFNSLFYCSNGDEGDIIIDCSYTKFFLEMDKTGTPRYLMNICSWLAAIEKHTIKKDCFDPINFNPKYIDIKIDWKAKFNRFMERKIKPIEKMKTLFVVDNSGSVFKQETYFNKVLHLFLTNFNAERGDAFYIWNEYYEKLEIDEIETFINEMDGIKGTKSSVIAEIANLEQNEYNNNFEHLIIVTDGDVSNEEVDLSDQKVKEYNLHFSFVSTFIIDTGDLKNESVGCPYSRDCPGYTYIVDYQGNQREQASLYGEDFQIFNNLNKIKTYEEFKSKYGNIYRIFRAKCLGKNPDDELKRKYTNFIKNIDVPKKNKNDFDEKIKDIEFMINGGLRNFQPIAC